ncbi:hypothetical protein [Clostridium estertheticum]|uniref:hypothetical protein n=1 Tax=Clostridium estertheticum TaxID=238834 RepID=UPI001CF34F67|nr:hypothetical protein [Clostridium estertheticum]MCB2354332.1 hypothetical protein [Clostridium estertheticum]WAG42549.1 hypothetical protein LL065_07710 [Clostridium estertheticum]
MADINLQMTQRNEDNTAWDNLNPKTIGANVSIVDSSNVFTATNVEGALSELFTSASSGKALIKTAITGKGGTVVDANGDGTYTHQELADGVNSITKGQGNAVESQVLGGATFSNADGKTRTGTMPNNGTINITPTTSSQSISSGFTTGGTVGAVSVPVAKVLNDTTIAGVTGTMVNQGNKSYTPSANAQAITEGYYKGGYIQGSPNSISENIKNRVVINGVTGNLIPMNLTAGNNNIYSVFTNSAYYAYATTTDRSICTFTVNVTGIIRMTYSLYSSGGNGNLSLYKNGASLHYDHTSDVVTVTYDIAVNSGDIIELHLSKTSSGTTCWVENVFVKTGGTPFITVTV